MYQYYHTNVENARRKLTYVYPGWKSSKDSAKETDHASINKEGASPHKAEPRHGPKQMKLGIKGKPFIQAPFVKADPALSITGSFLAVVTVLDTNSNICIEEFVHHYFWQGVDCLLFLDKTLDGSSALKAISVAHNLGRVNDLSVITVSSNSSEEVYEVAHEWFDAHRIPYLVAVVSINDFAYSESTTLALRLRHLFLTASSTVEHISCESSIFLMSDPPYFTQGIRESNVWRRRSPGNNVSIRKYNSNRGVQSPVCPKDIHFNHYELGSLVFYATYPQHLVTIALVLWDSARKRCGIKYIASII